MTMNDKAMAALLGGDTSSHASALNAKVLSISSRLPSAGVTRRSGKKRGAEAHPADRTNDADADVDTTSSSSSSTDSGYQRVKRKPTYAARREETALLRQQADDLQAQVDELRKLVGAPTRVDTQQVTQMATSSALMQNTLHEQRLQAADLQAILTTQQWNPLSTVIQLGTDHAMRREALLALRSPKLGFAHRYLTRRLRYVDITIPYQVSERRVSPAGDYQFSHCDVLQFPGVESVKQVFDALQLYMFNMEMTISERLGEITLRDDLETVDSNTGQVRMLSTTDAGVTIEKNTVALLQYYPRFGDEEEKELGGDIGGANEAKGGEYAVVAIDSVDEDLLYPYEPKTRVRKEFSMVTTLSSYRRRRGTTALLPTSHGSATDHPKDLTELVVVLKRSAFVKFVRPEFPLSRAEMTSIGHSMAWSDLMVSTMMDTLYPRQRPADTTASV